MPTPLSPRTPPPRLTSTVVAQWGTPRREMSSLQRRAMALGFTFRAGPKTCDRLRRGMPIREQGSKENLPENP